jgi:hypothetical protein
MNVALDLSGDRRRAGVHGFIMVLIAAATFLAIGAIAAWYLQANAF